MNRKFPHIKTDDERELILSEATSSKAMLNVWYYVRSISLDTELPV